MPPEEAPWEGAMVRGEAHSLHDAVEMVFTAMACSQGWDEVVEDG